MFQLMNSLTRIHKLLFALIVASFFGFFFYQLPWHQKIMLNFQDLIGQEIFFQVEDSTGSKKTLVLRPRDKKYIFNFLTLKPLWIKTSYPDDINFSYDIGPLRHNLLIKRTGSFFPEHESFRSNPIILEAIFLVSLLIFLFIWLILENFPRQPVTNWKSYVLFTVIHLSILTFLFWLTYPGLFNWDSFENFKDSGQYYNSAFTGDFHGSILMILFQLIPKMWILSLWNGVVIFCSLTIISVVSIKLKLEKIYFFLLILFFINPTHSLISFFAVRDISSFWFFNTTIFYVYYLVLEERSEFKNILLLFFLVLMTSLSRQEAIYIILPGLLYIFFQFHKTLLRPALAISLSSIIVLFSLRFIGPGRLENYKYQTTLIINPLSYILKNIYPDGLPNEVISQFGPYFKMNYLIDYQDDYDIIPFHKGGVNSSANQYDYLKFRSASIDMILSHPYLWLKNRLILSSYLFGFRRSYLLDDQYFNSGPLTRELFEDIKGQVLSNDLHRSKTANQVVRNLLSFLYHQNIIFSSYLLPLLFLIALLFLKPFPRIYAVFLGISTFRSLLVIMISPAGYLKYLYPLWLYASFGIILVLAEQRLRLTKEPSAFKKL